MERFPVDPDEMAKRSDEDFIAKLNMIGEGSPIFTTYPHDGDDLFERKAHAWKDSEELPETYQ